MIDFKIIDLTPDNIAEYGVCGYKDIEKHLELRRKIDWFREYYPRGLRIKAVISTPGGYQGMIEYIPGKYAHRPVRAEGYLFIHCIFVGFKGEFKGKGLGTALLDACIREAREMKMVGVAVVTRKGSFMADSGIFIKKGFIHVDSSRPDFELLALKFDESASEPSFRCFQPPDYGKGLTVIRSAQCPYSVKNVDAILETAKKLRIKSTLIDIEDHVTAQKTPSPFGTFCIIHDNEVISHHPISNKRFENIMAGRKL
jgi:GNAT superfamily N-acetyltransferase